MTYEFICVDCCNKRLNEYSEFIGEKPNSILFTDPDFKHHYFHDLDLFDFKFDIDIPLSELEGAVAQCPGCGSKNTQRHYSSFAVHYGLTASQKSAGTTKKRVEMGQFMHDQKNKRKKEHAPGTREHDSNELWLGNEFKNGVLKKSDMK